MEDLSNKRYLELGSHKAGELISYSITEQFPAKIEDIKGNCSCQVQEWGIKDTVLQDGEEVGYIYTINGQISTGIRFKPDRELQKMLTITLAENKKIFYILKYTLYGDANTDTTTTSTTPHVGKRNIRVSVHNPKQR